MVGMKKYDLGSSLFWLLLSLLILIESLRLGVGSLQNPGMGFMAFATAGLLGILSLILFVRTMLIRGEVKAEPLFSRTIWRKGFVVFLALVIYARFMPAAGYLIGTFLLMSFLYWILEPNRMRWVFWSLLLSLLTTVTSYYIFSVLLNCQFPSGIFSL